MQFSIYSELQSWPGKTQKQIYEEALEQVVNADRHQTLGLRAAHDAVLEDPGEEARKDGDDFDAHNWLR